MPDTEPVMTLPCTHGDHHHRRLLAAAGLSMVGVGASVNPIAVCLTSMGRSFEVADPARLGLVPTVTFCGVVAGIVLAGPCADRWGLKRFMILGAAAQILGLCVMGLAPSFAVLLALASLVGFGSGIIDALASPLVSRLEPDNRTGALNFLHACYPVGAMLMIQGSSVLLARSGSWRGVFPAMALPTLASLALFSFSRFPRHEGHSFQFGAVAELFRKPAFLVGIAAVFLAGATESSVAQWTPAFMEKAFSWSPQAGANVLLGFSLGMSLGRLGTGGIAKRLRPSQLMLWSALGCFLCLVLSGLSPAWVAAGVLILHGLFVSCLWPTSLAYTADRLPGSGATVFSLLATSGNTGFMLAPGAIGLVSNGIGLRWGMTLAGLFPLLALCLFAFVERRRGSESP